MNTLLRTRLVKLGFQFNVAIAQRLLLLHQRLQLRLTLFNEVDVSRECIPLLLKLTQRVGVTSKKDDTS